MQFFIHVGGEPSLETRDGKTYLKISPGQSTVRSATAGSDSSKSNFLSHRSLSHSSMRLTFSSSLRRPMFRRRDLRCSSSLRPYSRFTPASAVRLLPPRGNPAAARRGHGNRLHRPDARPENRRHHPPRRPLDLHRCLRRRPQQSHLEEIRPKPPRALRHVLERRLRSTSPSAPKSPASTIPTTTASPTTSKPSAPTGASAATTTNTPSAANPTRTATSGSSSASPVPSPPTSDWRGWCVRVTPDGKMIPTCSGIRSPGGIGFNAEGDVFYTDNQGLWNGSSSLKWLKPGSFQGNPTGNKFHKLANLPAPPDVADKSRILAERTRIPGIHPARRRPAPRQGRPIAHRHRLRPERRQIRPVGKPALRRRANPLRGPARLPGKGQRPLSGRGLPFPRRLRSRPRPRSASTRQAGILFAGGSNRGWASRGSKPFTFERVKLDRQDAL